MASFAPDASLMAIQQGEKSTEIWSTLPYNRLTELVDSSGVCSTGHFAALVFAAYVRVASRRTNRQLSPCKFAATDPKASRRTNRQLSPSKPEASRRTNRQLSPSKFATTDPKAALGVRVWCTVTGRVLDRLIKVNNLPIRAISSDGMLLAFAIHTVVVYCREYDARVSFSIKYPTYINACAFTPDSRHLVTSSTTDCILWDCSGVRVASFPCAQASLLYTSVQIVFSPDGTRIARSIPGTCETWPVSDSTLPRSTRKIGGRPKALAFTRGGTHLAVSVDAAVLDVRDVCIFDLRS